VALTSCGSAPSEELSRGGCVDHDTLAALPHLSGRWKTPSDKRYGHGGEIVSRHAVPVDDRLYAILLRGLPFRAADELVVITEANKALDAGLVSPTAYLEWRERNRSFDDMAAFMWWEGSGEDPMLTVSVTPKMPAKCWPKSSTPAIGTPNGSRA
jgi:hypothetical protein